MPRPPAQKPASPLAVAAALALSALSGCQSREVPGVALSGYVTAKGQPVDGISIHFFPDLDKEGRGATASIENGRYAIPADVGPFPGPLNVIFSPPVQGSEAAKATPIPPAYQQPGAIRVTLPPARKSFVYDFTLDEPAATATSPSPSPSPTPVDSPGSRG